MEDAMVRVIALVSPSPIFPGQAATLHWVVCSDDPSTPAPNCTVQVTLEDGTVIAAGPPLPAATFGTVALPRLALADSGVALSSFYQAGVSHMIFVTATPSGGAAPLPAAGARLKIATTVPQPSIVLTQPTPMRQWKQPYSCVVQVRNNAHAGMAYACILREAQNAVVQTSVSEDAANWPLAAQGGTVNPTPMTSPQGLEMGNLSGVSPGATQSLVFAPPIVKGWDWLQVPFYTLDGPTAQAWTYDAQVTGTDEFGNSYPAVGSPSLLVRVSVSEEKLGDAQTAMMVARLGVGVTVVGIIATIASLGWGAAVAGPTSTGVFAIAAGEGNAAQDPPAPDPQFKTRVPLTAPDLSLSAAGAIGQWVQTAHDFMTYRVLLFPIQAKILGALESKDSEGEILNVRDHVELVRKMFAAIRTLVKLTPAVDNQLRDLPQGVELARSLAGIQDQLRTDAWPFDLVIPAHLQAFVKSRAMELRAEDLDLTSRLREVTSAFARLTHSVVASSMDEYLHRKPDAKLEMVLRV
jgi:hypothetical protein